MNRRQRERKLRAKRDWQAHVRKRRRSDPYRAQAFYAGSFITGAIMPGVGYIFSGTVIALEELAEQYRALASAVTVTLDAHPNNPEAGLVDHGEPAYRDDMPGMTLDEFQAWSDQLIREVQGE